MSNLLYILLRTSLGIFLLLLTAYSSWSEQQHSPSPIWYRLAEKETLDKNRKLDIFRVISSQLGATENRVIPEKDALTLRIATYNVHGWLRPWLGFKDNFDDSAYDNMLKVIKWTNSDVLILQEVANIAGRQRRDDFKDRASRLGYNFIACCDTGPLLNCILSKQPMTDIDALTFKTNPPSPKTYDNEKRCFVRGSVSLPSSVEKLSVYATHLEVRDLEIIGADMRKRDVPANIVRQRQILELINYIEKNDKNNNVMIGADFNSPRKEDLQYPIADTTAWSLFSEETNKVGKSPSSEVFDELKNRGYVDAFSTTNVTVPYFTVWSGTRIDFLMLGPKWNLPLKESYVFYNWSSDHIPVILDIKL